MIARKGDALLVEIISHDYIIGESRRTRTRYHFGMVSSATREGTVKTWQAIGWGDDLLSTGMQPMRGQRVYVLPAKDFDVTGLLTAAKAHHWPNHPGQPMPFDSVDDARECARPYRLNVQVQA